MTIGAKILAGLAGFCFLLWGITLALGVQPLFPDVAIEVLYGMHEEFHDDATAFRKFRNTGLVIIRLPEAPPERRWWAIDFGDRTIRKISSPRSLTGAYYVMKGDLAGAAIGSDARPDAWLWQVDGNTASFANRAFVCLVKRGTGN